MAVSSPIKYGKETIKESSRKEKEMKIGPVVKQIDGSVVSWKPEQIALRTAPFSNLPESR